MMMALRASAQSTVFVDVATNAIETVNKQLTNQIADWKVKSQALSKYTAGPPPTATKATTEVAKYKEAIQVATQAQAYLNGGEVPDPGTMKRVRETVVWLARPVWAICQGAPWFSPTVPTSADYSGLVQPYAETFRQIAGSIGMITAYQKETDGSRTMRGMVGTGIVIGAHRILTNKHVVTDGYLGYEDASHLLKLFDKVETRIQFPVEYQKCRTPPGITQTRTVTVSAIEPLITDLDIAVLVTKDALPGKIDFPATADVVPGDRIAVIGYPTRPGDVDTFLTPKQIDSVFATPDGRVPFFIERFASGSAVPDPTAKAGLFAYDATTWEGNSGSIVVSLVTGKVIGLHADGLQAKNQGQGYNEGILAPSVADVLVTLPPVAALAP